MWLDLVGQQGPHPRLEPSRRSESREGTICLIRADLTWNEAASWPEASPIDDLAAPCPCGVADRLRRAWTPRRCRGRASRRACARHDTPGIAREQRPRDLDWICTARLPAPNMSENIPAYSGKCASIRHTHWVLSSAAMPRSDSAGSATATSATPPRRWRAWSSYCPMRSVSAMSQASMRSFLTLSSPRACAPP